MVNVQLENGYTKVANELVEAFCRFRINGMAWQVLWAILCKTYGFNKKEDWIAHSQIVKLTGLLKGNVSRELSKLITHKIVIETDNKLRLNKNYDEWISFEGNHYNPKLSKPITKVIVEETPVIVNETKVIGSEGNKIQYTKETITKEITTNVVTGFGNPDINEISKYFLQVMQLPKEDCPELKSRRYWNNLLKEYNRGVMGVKKLIDIASEDEWYKNNITSSMDLWYKRVKIIARKRGSINKNKVAVNPAIKEAV
jgi:phage replication O-like protein O